VTIEEVDGIYYFSTMALRERVALFWRRRGEMHEKMRSILRSTLRWPRRP
jgi:hypothetical protein